MRRLLDKRARTSLCDTGQVKVRMLCRIQKLIKHHKKIVTGILRGVGIMQRLLYLVDLRLLYRFVVNVQVFLARNQWMPLTVYNVDKNVETTFEGEKSRFSVKITLATTNCNRS